MNKKRQALTLIEMMLVILLIGVVSSALTVNIKGALTKSRRFKTEEMKKKIDTVLNLALLEGYSVEEVEQNWIDHLKDSPLISIPSSSHQVLDGYKKPFHIKLSDDGYSLSAYSENTSEDHETQL